MIAQLAYGQGHRAVELPADRTTVIEPRHAPELPDERAAVMAALDHPIKCPPLREWLRPGGTVCIAFTDSTRATPNDRLIPWLLEYLADVPPNRITLLNQVGTHRPNTRAELTRMLTPAVLERYRVLNHEPDNPSALVPVGRLRDGTPALINRHLVEADVRIVTGFIEPHFFAGFSGGPKGILPGCAGLATVLSHHGPRNIGHPNATFGITDGNPLWEELRDVALQLGPSFLLNVALNQHRRLTGVFAGHIVAAHRAGVDHVRESAMRSVDSLFDVVVTSNSGYPLDQNLYQTVKGMSAGARILQPGGTLIVASECREGAPPNSSYERLLRESRDATDVLQRLHQADRVIPDQWQVQIQAQIQLRARVLLHSALPEEVVRACHLEPCADIGRAVRNALECAGPSARVAILPQGPLTIPYRGGHFAR